MSEQMFIILTLRKPVADVTEGRSLYELVKTRLADHTDVTINGGVSNHFEDED